MIPFKGILSAFGAKGIEELGVRSAEGNASRIAGTYYHLTDGRFTAWGASSKVMVPQAAGKIAKYMKAASVVGWAVTDYELYKAISTCKKKL